jgi:hypothetical protein
MATSSLQFSGLSFVQPRLQGSPNPDGMAQSFPYQSKITMAFWMKVNTLPSSGWSSPVAIGPYGGAGMWPRVDSNGTIAFDLYVYSDGTGAAAGFSTGSIALGTGTAAHWYAVFDGSSAVSGEGNFQVYRNGILVLSSTINRVGPNYFGFNQNFAFGNFRASTFGSQDGDIKLADVAVWGDYAGTLQDAIDLTDQAKRPSDIADDQRIILITGDGGTVGADVGATDVGARNAANLLNEGWVNFASNEGFTYTFAAVGGGTGDSNQGTIKYADPLSYTPPIEASPYLPASGEGIAFLFATKGGQKAHIPTARTRANVLEFGPTLEITRSGGGVDTVTLDPAYCYFSNAFSPDAGGAYGQDWIYFDLRAQGVAAIDPLDTVHVTAARHWILLTEGACDAIDADAPRSSPLPAVPPGRKTLRVGYNLEPPFAFTLPYYGNMARWADNGRPRLAGGGTDWSIPRDPTTGQWIPGAGPNPGGYFESTLLNPDGTFGMDQCATRGPNRDGSGDEQYANASYDNPAYGTSGFKLGNGSRVLPKRGKIHVAWDYYPGHDGDGEVLIRLYPYDNDFGHGESGGSAFGPQVYSWTFNPAVQAGTGGANYYRTYEYVGNDPINGLGATGARLTPQLMLRHTGYCMNIRVTVEAVGDLPEAAYNVDKFTPPVFHPYLTGEVLRDIDTIRLMNWSDTYDTGLSDVDQFTPYEHYTWGVAFSEGVFDQNWPLTIPIVSVTPYTEPEATALRATWAGANGGGCPMKITLASPHYLAHGATNQIEWVSSVTMTGVNDQDGLTYNIYMQGTGWFKVARPLSSTELLSWAWFYPENEGGPPNQTYGILSRTYSGAELGGAYVEIKRRRTLPLRAVGELATQCGLNVHYCLPYAIAIDPAKVAAWADAVAPYSPAGKELYVEVANELWNTFGPYSIALQVPGDDLGLVDGQQPNNFQKYSQHVRITARVAKVIRQRWTANSLDPAKVKCLVNSGPGSYNTEIIAAITEMNTSGDPLLRIDELCPNTYWGNFGDEEDMAAFPGAEALGVEQTLDIFELRVSRGNYSFANTASQRAQLDAAGLTDVKLTSYEGGSDKMAVGEQYSAAFDHTNVATQADCARLGRLQLGVFRNPRWAGIMNAAMTRQQAAGLTRQTRYVATALPFPGYQNGHTGEMPTRAFWTSYLSMEPSGKGDGSDGKWDNRASAERPYGPYAEGDSVSVDAYAIKEWNAAVDGPDPEPAAEAAGIDAATAWYYAGA